MTEDMLVVEMPNEEGEEVKEGWRIKNDLDADWAISKIKEARADLERKERLAEQKIQETKDWIERERQKTANSTAFFEAKLREYFNSLDKSVLKKAKTQLKYELMSGTLKLKKQPPVIKRDNSVLMEWLLNAGLDNLIRVKEEPDWSAIKERLELIDDKAVYKDTGEVIPGITVEPQPDKFIVE